MAEPSREVPNVDKLRFAGTVLACIAAVAQRQGDAFGLVVCTDGRTEFTPASRGPRQLQRVLAQLAKARPQGTMPDAATLKSSLHFARAPSLVFAAGDCLEWPSPLSEALLRLRRMRHDVRALCLQTQAERDASFTVDKAYKDPEQGEGVFRFGADVAAAYRQQREAHFDQVIAACRHNDIPTLSACIEEPLVAIGGARMISLWWFALPVLLLPIWWHRQKKERTDVAMLATARFLPATSPEQQRVWRWLDVVLLLLRCLLLATVIAWLADMVVAWRGDAVLVAPGTTDTAWVDQQVAQAGFKGADRIQVPEADVFGWLARHEREWKNDARLLLVGN
eukprot:gene20049-39646_t